MGLKTYNRFFYFTIHSRLGLYCMLFFGGRHSGFMVSVLDFGLSSPGPSPG